MIVVCLWGVVCAITLASCWSDLKRLMIPNEHSIAIVGLFVLAFVLSPASFGSLTGHLLTGFLFFIVGFLLFARGMLGGGDAKLAAALGLWLGPKAVIPFLFFMSLAGGLLALFSIYIKKRKPFPKADSQSWIGQIQAGRSALPYGIAISFGSWLGIFHTTEIGQKLHEVISLAN